MKLQLSNKIVLISIVLTCVLISGCNVVNNEGNNDLLVDYFHIKFTDYIILMDTPTDTVGVENFSEKAAHLQTYFYSVDEKLFITRFRPDFQPSDTLRITAEGDSIRKHNWALVYKFQLTKLFPFKELEEIADEEPLIEWVDPPMTILNIRQLD